MEEFIEIQTLEEAEVNDRHFRMLLRLPLSSDWCEFKGETFFAIINYEATKKANKPMVDLFYCATQAINHCLIKTVQWDSNKFTPSPLANTWHPTK